MATDFIVFIHGVNNRSSDDFKAQAQKMFDVIKKEVGSSSTRKLEPIFLFWGDIAQNSITELSKGLQGSDDNGKTAKDAGDFATWKKFWFPELRKNAILNFVGDAALYLSRGVSVKIIKQLTDQALCQLKIDLQQMQQKSPLDGDEDRLHLVTHSWGTVILFDIMFADRWEEKDLDSDILQSVENLRSCFFGIGKDLDTSDGAATNIKNVGIPLASLHTMGSPITLFNLINSGEGKNFNLTPKLKEFLKSSSEIMGAPLPWQNYAHPGDPIAYPLTGAMKLSLEDAIRFVSIKDIVTTPSLLEQAVNLVPVFPLSLLGGGGAHGSYWTNADVAKNIAKVIRSTFPTP
jgi:hypothetical protein